MFLHYGKEFKSYSKKSIHFNELSKRWGDGARTATLFTM